MRTFIFTSDKFQGELEVAFAPSGWLHRVENRSDMSENQLTGFLRNVPIHSEPFLAWVKHNKLTAVEVPENLDFDRAFWPLWPGPVANRARAVGQLINGTLDIALQPRTVDASGLAQDVEIGAFAARQCLDEMHQLDIRIAARLGTLRSRRKSAQTGLVQFSDKFLALNGFRSATLRHGVCLSKIYVLSGSSKKDAKSSVSQYNLEQ